jgi:hypothetical protein
MDNDFNRRKDLNRTELVDRSDTGRSGMTLAALAILAIIFGLLMWAPWNGPRTADNASLGTTVGSSPARPVTPAAPAAPAPASPSPNR